MKWRHIMAEQVLIQFRADKALKQEVTEIYESLGSDLPEMTLEEINEEISAARAEREKR